MKTTYLLRKFSNVNLALKAEFYKKNGYAVIENYISHS